MTRGDIASDLRKFTGGGTITCTELCRFLCVKDQYKAKKKYLQGLQAIGGTHYLITEVAERLKGAAV